MGTTKKLLEVRAPRAAGHPARSMSRSCLAGVEQREEELLCACSASPRRAHRSQEMLEFARVFHGCQQPPRSMPEPPRALRPAALGCLQLVHTGLWRSPLGMDPGRGDVGTSGVNLHEERGILANLEHNSPLRLPGLASQANGAGCLVFMLYRCFEVPALSLIKKKKKRKRQHSGMEAVVGLNMRSWPAEKA